MLGAAPIEVRLGEPYPEPYQLRPTLRAALALARLHGSPAELAGKIGTGSLTAMSDVVVHGTNGAAPATPTSLEKGWLRAALAALQSPCLAYVHALADIPEAKGKASAKAKAPATFVEFYEGLFGTATGALGWPPEQAWNASPAEIVLAARARVEMLQSLFGTPGKDNKRADLSLDDKARLAVASLRDRAAKPKAPSNG